MKNDGEKIVALETEMKNIDNRMEKLEKSIQELHGKFDLITTNYVHKDTFEEYKKNKWLERIITVLITAILSGLVAFFLRSQGV